MMMAPLRMRRCQTDPNARAAPSLGVGKPVPYRAPGLTSILSRSIHYVLLANQSLIRVIAISLAQSCSNFNE